MEKVMGTRRNLVSSIIIACFILFMSLGASSSIVMQMNMAQLTENADKVFRGTVLDIEASSVSIGGADFPTVIYTMKVEDPIKGEFATEKEFATVTIQMLGNIKPVSQTGNMRRLSMIDQNPKLKAGYSYVLFTTTPSKIGLSTTVGLEQGLFRVFSSGVGRDMAVNSLNNDGLFNGAVSYSDLKTAILSEIK